MFRYKVSSSFLSLLLCYHGLAQPAQLTVGFSEFRPYNYLNDQGEASGSAVDLVRVILATSGYRFSAKVYPAKRNISNMLRGEYDLLMCMGRAQYDLLGDQVDYSDVALGSMTLQAYHLNSRPIIKHKEALLGQGLVLRRGFNYGGLIQWIKQSENQFTTQLVNNTEQGLRLILAGRQDYFLDYKAAMDIALSHQQLPQLRSSKLSTADYFLVFSKRHRGTNLQQKIETAAKQVLAELDAKP